MDMIEKNTYMYVRTNSILLQRLILKIFYRGNWESLQNSGKESWIRRNNFQG